MPAIEDEELLTSTMSTWRENTTLKMPGLLNTNEHHDRRTQTPGAEEEDDAHGGNAARRTEVKLF